MNRWLFGIVGLCFGMLFGLLIATALRPSVDELQSELAAAQQKAAVDAASLAAAGAQLKRDGDALVEASAGVARLERERDDWRARCQAAEAAATTGLSQIQAMPPRGN